MSDGNAKKILLISVFAGILFTASVLVIWRLSLWPNDQLEVDILDVGQGDSILIKTPAGQNILVDGGPDKKVLIELGKHLPWWDRKIDLIILTHGHDDHLLGLLEVLKHYEVGKAMSLESELAGTNINWQYNLKTRNVQLVLTDRPQVIDLGKGVRLEMLYPFLDDGVATVAKANNDSIILRLSYGQSSILLTGDSEGEVEGELIDSHYDISSTAIKIGHHGSDNSTSEVFLEKVKPEIALISVGKDNTFGHPSRRVLKRLERDGVRIYRTDQQGAITLKTYGGEWLVDTEK